MLTPTPLFGAGSIPGTWDLSSPCFVLVYTGYGGDMRKVLLDEDWAGSWSSCGCYGVEERRFMLGYRPFIDALESGVRPRDLPWERFYSEFSERFPGKPLPGRSDRRLVVVEVPDSPGTAISGYEGEFWLVRDEAKFV